MHADSPRTIRSGAARPGTIRSGIARSGTGRVGLLAGVAVLALLASACGSNTASTAGSGSSDSSAAPTSSAAATDSSSTPASSSSSEGGSGSSSSGSAPASSSAPESSTAAGGDAKTATSAKDLGGMEGLVAAANKEGALNVIALPPDWADYKEIITGFKAKYPNIKVTSAQPDISSAEEIQAADKLKGTDQAPDVFDLGAAVTLKSTAFFAPYKVAAWADIPDANKEPTGLFVNDYTGVMSVGYNADKFGDVTSLDQLKDAKFKGAVALNGNPTQANAALNGVVMAAVANGGSLDDVSKGVDYFKSLKAAGSFSSIDPTPATLVSGQVGVVFDWSYNQLGAAVKLKAEGVNWKTFTPSKVAIGAYYNQAINKGAPHPAAARLWEEYLYSPAAQNFWLKGGASPILYQAMKKAGTVDPAAEANLPKTDSAVQQLTAAQATAVNAYLAANWSKAVGS